MEDLTRQVTRALQEHHLASRGDVIVYGLSGGADSVALLRCLVTLGMDVRPVHCNFHLRGEESQRDETFCRKLCAQLDLGLDVASFDTRAYARRQGVSIEMAARELRYAYFEQRRKALHADRICVAHHQDDNAETLLLHLLRGSGIKGLAGMKWANGYVIRPLLGVTREEVLRYLDAIHQDYVTDSSNLVADVLRNRVRLQLLPLMEEISPRAKRRIALAAGHIAEAYQYMEHHLDEEAKGCRVPVPEGQRALSLDKLRTVPSPHLLLLHWLQDYGFNPTQIAEMTEAADTAADATWRSSAWQVDKWRGQLLLHPIMPQEPQEPPRIDREGTYRLPGYCLTVHTEAYAQPSQIPHDHVSFALDTDRLSWPLQVRPWQRGDRFAPFGMKGSKLVSDYLNDLKLTPYERESQTVMLSGDDICWVTGRRIDRRYAVDPKSSRNITILKLSQAPQGPQQAPN